MQHQIHLDQIVRNRQADVARTTKLINDLANQLRTLAMSSGQEREHRARHELDVDQSPSPTGLAEVLPELTGPGRTALDTLLNWLAPHIESIDVWR